MKRLWDCGHIHAFGAGGLFVFLLSDIARRDWQEAAITAGFVVLCSIVAIGDARRANG